MTCTKKHSPNNQVSVRSGILVMMFSLVYQACGAHKLCSGIRRSWEMSILSQMRWLFRKFDSPPSSDTSATFQLSLLSQGMCCSYVSPSMLSLPTSSYCVVLVEVGCLEGKMSKRRGTNGTWHAKRAWKEEADHCLLLLCCQMCLLRC